MMKRLVRSLSVILTLALVFSIVTCAPFSVSAARADDLAATAAEPEDTFGELNGGKYTLESLTYQLTDDYALEGYIYVPSGAEATIDLNGHTIDRGLTASSMAGYVNKNEGTLTIMDSSGSGKITGGYAERGGAVYNTGTLTMPALRSYISARPLCVTITRSLTKIYSTRSRITSTSTVKKSTIRLRAARSSLKRRISQPEISVHSMS